MPTSLASLLALAQVHATTTATEMETLGPFTLSKGHWEVVFRALRVLVTVSVALLLMRMVPLLERFVRRVASRAHEAREAISDGRERRHHLDTLTRVTASVAVAIIWTLASLMVLSDVGVAVGPLLATAGVAGVAIGFGAQSIVKDFLGGFFILVENQFDVGDTVVLGGVTGTVERMTMRITVVRDASGIVYFLPHGSIVTVANKTYGWGRTVVEATFAASVPESDVHELLAAAAKRATDVMRAEHLFTDNEVAVEGPVDFKAGRTTWRLVAKVRAECVARARGVLISALATDVRSRKYTGTDGVLVRVDDEPGQWSAATAKPRSSDTLPHGILTPKVALDAHTADADPVSEALPIPIPHVRPPADALEEPRAEAVPAWETRSYAAVRVAPPKLASAGRQRSS